MASIDGLTSGLDTTTIISQLMAIEKAPQQRLAARRQSALAQATTWGQIDSSLAALRTAAGRLGTGGVSATTASSSIPTTATVTSSTSAQPGTHTLVVTRLAKAHQVQSAAFPGPSSVVGAGSLVAASGLGAIGASGVSVTAGSAPPTGRYVVEVRADGSASVNGAQAAVTDNGDGTVAVGDLTFTASALAAGSVTVSVATATSATTTVAQLAAALGGVRGDVGAVAVDDGAGSTRLVLSATRTGAASALSVSATGFTGLSSASFPAATAEQVTALDAALVFDGVAVRRGSNTVTDLVPGATISLVRPDPGTEVTLAVTEDVPAVVAGVKGLVDALNGTLRAVGTATKYDPATKKGGSLVGDSGARALVDQVRRAASEARTPGGLTLSGVGVTLQRDGSYALDETRLTAALRDRPAAVGELVGAVTTRLGTAVDTLRGARGTVTTGKEGAESLAAGLQRQVDAWDSKLAVVEGRLRKQFAGLEKALSGLQNQGSWLSGQIKSLPSWGS